MALNKQAWHLIYDNLTSGLTNTGAYIQMLDDNAKSLARLGEHVINMDDLWHFQAQQAYGYTVIPELDSTVDSIFQTPGLRLDLARRFGSSLAARNSTGMFGNGWFTPWQATIVSTNGGNLVMLVGEAGSARIFTRDTRTGAYFSGAGDSAVLTDIGGGIYELRDPDGTVTRFRNDGKIDHVQDPNGNRISATYDRTGELSQLTHSSGAFISIFYNGAGLVQMVTNSAGRSMTYTYAGDYLQSATTDDGKTTLYTYETGGTLAQRNALTSVTRAGVTRHFTFDPRGRVTSTYLAGGEQLLTFSYEPGGVADVSDAAGTTRVFFDYRGLLAKVIDPLGNITTAEFNDNDRLVRIIAPTGESQSFTWCDCGSPTSILDELGQKTTFSYDSSFHRLTSFTDARGNTTHYTYDNRGNLLSTVYPNFSADQFGEYTASGLTTSYTNRRGQPIIYAYTSAGQVSRQTFADGTYNAFQYDIRGNLTNVMEHTLSGSTQVTAYTYNYATDGDRLQQVTYPNGRWVAYAYDAYGCRQQITDSTGQELNYDCDAAGRLWRLRDATNFVIAEYYYNPSGRLQRIDKGNGTYTTYSYNAAGELLHLTNSAPDGSVSSRFDYSYDSRGRRMRQCPRLMEIGLILMTVVGS